MFLFGNYAIELRFLFSLKAKFLSENTAKEAFWTEFPHMTARKRKLCRHMISISHNLIIHWSKIGKRSSIPNRFNSESYKYRAFAFKNESTNVSENFALLSRRGLKNCLNYFTPNPFSFKKIRLWWYKIFRSLISNHRARGLNKEPDLIFSIQSITLT